MQFNLYFKSNKTKHKKIRRPLSRRIFDQVEELLKEMSVDLVSLENKLIKLKIIDLKKSTAVQYFCMPEL